MDNEQFITLHRHWCWCNVIRKHFDDVLPGLQASGKSMADSPADRPAAYMYIWYRLLFAVLEVLRKTGTRISDIDVDIDAVYDPLRLCRNAVFHPQKKYWSRKLLAIMDDRWSAARIQRVHAGLGKWFLEELERRSHEENRT